MTIKIASVRANLEREQKGDWVEYPDWPGVSFNVSSLLIPAYRIDRDLLGQRLARQYKGKAIPPDILTTEIGKLFHKHILHGWQGFDKEYSKELAAEMMVDPEYRNLVEAVQYCANRLAETDIEFVEDAVKNSKRPSATG